VAAPIRIVRDDAAARDGMPPLIMVCVECSGMFERNPSRPWHIYCSRRCKRRKYLPRQRQYHAGRYRLNPEERRQRSRDHARKTRELAAAARIILQRSHLT